MFPAKSSVKGDFSRYLDIIQSRQLLDRELWRKCVGVFSSGIDDDDGGWRGEYWGKMMRGACLVFSVTGSDELYSVLTQAVEGLLSKQEPDGRISSYSREKEFYGWDIWARKYVMTGLQHYYDICRDEKLKERIMNSLEAHADYITAHIGEGKIPLLDTGLWWGSVNSATILEPFVRLYKDTGKPSYLEFARYIISTGGCSDGNLIDCVFEGKAPFEFPETKAYETMSFFEGLLAYYELTGEEYYLDAVKRFVHSLLETDFTAIGSCGCTHELFDNSTLRQTEPCEKIMQETCVTVTLMRLLARVFRITGEKELFDALQKSALNALAGALNINGYDQFSNEKKKYLPGMVFDSYSPLCDGARARGIGGFKEFADGSHFGCCACIASAGFALYPLMCVTQSDTEIRVNALTEGEFTFERGGESITLKVTEGEIKVSAPEGASFNLFVTEGTDSLRITASKDGIALPAKGGYYRFEGVKGGDIIRVSARDILTETVTGGKSSFALGGYTLAADESRGDAYIPGEKTVFIRNGDGSIVYKTLPAADGEHIRISANTERGELILTDYASSGQDGRSRVSVWF